MSKTWKQTPHQKRTNDERPQKLVDRLKMREAEEDIREIKMEAPRG